jgi:hypothetical protein
MTSNLSGAESPAPIWSRRRESVARNMVVFAESSMEPPGLVFGRPGARNPGMH